MKILDRIYYKYNKRLVDEGIKYFKSISVKQFVERYIEGAAAAKGKYKIIRQNEDYADILINRENRKYLLRYHKCSMVFIEQYKNFAHKVELNNADKGFYITCGKFEEKIYKHHKEGGMLGSGTSFRIKLIDSFQIIKKHLRFRRSWSKTHDLDVINLLLH